MIFQGQKIFFEGYGPKLIQNGPKIGFFKLDEKSVRKTFPNFLHEVTSAQSLEIDSNDFLGETFLQGFTAFSTFLLLGNDCNKTIIPCSTLQANFHICSNLFFHGLYGILLSTIVAANL